MLMKRPDGSVVCRFTAPPAPQVTFTPFADQYGLAYDYDKIWTTDTNNVLTGLSYSGTTTLNTNANTRNGQWGARSTYADANNRAYVVNPFYGGLANDQTNVNIFTDSTQISQAATTPLTVVDTVSTGFDTGATFGSYLPGTTATPREVEEGEGGGSEDNLVFPIRNQAALGGWFGRRR
ncbi:hypothetical protein OEZ86_009748 [Tetradesmus obliquus]|uniref:Uncharacterized protein n=1 Tax=Tetradesmus obliquus TaxID=3088 RepID=A0ABY8UN80_TETOB|nr:hypothetical protein OEZ85_001191 [Tetradesmus obliquus]WIA43242.1 hypothetical protein OEZ86_009748 [Tetradesmus obliquus]